MSSEMSMTFQRPLKSTILTLPKKSCWNKPNKMATTLASLNDVIDRIIESYQNHPNVWKAKNKIGSDLNSFDFHEIKVPKVKKKLLK